MVLGVSAIFRASVGQHAAQPDLVLIVEGHHAVVEEIGRGERGRLKASARMPRQAAAK